MKKKFLIISIFLSIFLINNKAYGITYEQFYHFNDCDNNVSLSDISQNGTNCEYFKKYGSSDLKASVGTYSDAFTDASSQGTNYITKANNGNKDYNYLTFKLALNPSSTNDHVEFRYSEDGKDIFYIYCDSTDCDLPSTTFTPDQDDINFIPSNYGITFYIYLDKENNQYKYKTNTNPLWSSYYPLASTTPSYSGQFSISAKSYGRITNIGFANTEIIETDKNLTFTINNYDSIDYIRKKFLNYNATTTLWDLGYIAKATNQSYWNYVCALIIQEKNNGINERDCKNASSSIIFYNPIDYFSFENLEEGTYNLYIGFASTTDGFLYNTKNIKIYVDEENILPIGIYDIPENFDEIEGEICLLGYCFDILKPIKNSYNLLLTKFPFSWIAETKEILMTYYQNKGEESSEPFKVIYTIPNTISNKEFKNKEINLIDFKEGYNKIPELFEFIHLILKMSIWLSTITYIYIKTLYFFKNLTHS